MKEKMRDYICTGLIGRAKFLEPACHVTPVDQLEKRVGKSASINWLALKGLFSQMINGN
jgi:hypothetical protein